MNIKQKLSVLLVAILILFFAVRALVIANQVLVISDTRYECDELGCNYEFKIKNRSHFSAKAKVRVRLSQFGGVRGDTLLSSELVSLVVPAASSTSYKNRLSSEKRPDSVGFILVSER